MGVNGPKTIVGQVGGYLVINTIWRGENVGMDTEL